MKKYYHVSIVCTSLSDERSFRKRKEIKKGGKGKERRRSRDSRSVKTGRERERERERESE
jgi:hypothetical protein